MVVNILFLYIHIEKHFDADNPFNGSNDYFIEGQPSKIDWMEANNVSDWDNDKENTGRLFCTGNPTAKPLQVSHKATRVTLQKATCNPLSSSTIEAVPTSLAVSYRMDHKLKSLNNYSHFSDKENTSDDEKKTQRKL